jgi:branched-chain amino acid transport system ATP-binding protein
MLKIKDLNVSIRSVRILRGVNLELPTGAVAGLIGRNGAGKTTLMRSIMGLLPAGSGLVEFDGINLRDVPAYGRTGLGIGYMPEDRRLIPELTVAENILLPAWAIGAKGGPERLEKIYEMIPEISAFSQRQAMELSGGQQKLVAIGRALMCGHKLLLLDEPFEGVAPVLAQRLVEVVGGFIKEQLSVILSESNLQHSTGMLDKVFQIDRGAVSQGG